MTNSSWDMFVAKYDTAGNFRWVRQAGGTTDQDVGRGVAVDRDENILVTGYVQGPATFGGTNIDSTGTFLAKYDSNGNLIWVKQQTYSGLGVATGSSGNIYLSGYGGSFLAKLGFLQITANGLGGSCPLNFTNLNSVQVGIQSTVTNGAIFYTLDGTAPDFSSTQYTAPFLVAQSVVLRGIVYDNFFNSVEAGPIPVNLWQAYPLRVDTSGGGTVSLSPPVGPYVSNSIVNATAIPSAGWTFGQWLGDASGTNSSVNVAINGPKSLYAIFGTAINVAVTGNGVVSINPASGPYPYGSIVRLTALPSPGSFFALWGNAASGNVNPLSFVVTNATPTIFSLFSSLSTNQVALSVVSDGNGKVVVSPRANVYSFGQSVTLTATPDALQDFIGWTGDAIGTENPLSVLMNQSKIITSHFTKRPRLSVNSYFEGLVRDGFRLTLKGEFERAYRIDASTNLVDWSPLMTITNTYGTTQFTDPAATNLPARFYRAAAE